MKNIFSYAGVALIGIAAVGLIFAVTLEIVTEEPVYMLIVKISAGLFGVGGPLLGFGIARKSRRRP